jgi:Oxidoreductase family, NAD-binding Rossmann fold
MKTLVVLATTASSLIAAEIRLGLVGCDTSHATAFTQILNNAAAKNHVAGARVVAAVKSSSPDIDSSHTRVEGYAKELAEKWGVKFYDSIEAMCRDVDAVLIESVDGRPHLAQARPVIAAKKPVFIDKPLAAGLRDAIEIARLARESGVPVWTGSSYRWYPSMVELKAANVGEVRGAISYGPAHLDERHVDLTWYGIHPTEALYTIMGQGCESVVRVKTSDTDVVVGRWSGGRTGTLVGLRTKALPHKVTVFGSAGFAEQKPTQHDYAPLVAEIIKFLQTGKAPVPMEETIEMFSFMEAADESAKRGGAPVKLSEMLERAKEK